jgi:hypothetical protein
MSLAHDRDSFLVISGQPHRMSGSILCHATVRHIVTQRYLRL